MYAFIPKKKNKLNYKIKLNYFFFPKRTRNSFPLRSSLLFSSSSSLKFIFWNDFISNKSSQKSFESIQKLWIVIAAMVALQTNWKCSLWKFVSRLQRPLRRLNAFLLQTRCDEWSALNCFSESVKFSLSSKGGTRQFRYGYEESPNKINPYMLDLVFINVTVGFGPEAKWYRLNLDLLSTITSKITSEYDFLWMYSRLLSPFFRVLISHWSITPIMLCIRFSFIKNDFSIIIASFFVGQFINCGDFWFKLWIVFLMIVWTTSSSMENNCEIWLTLPEFPKNHKVTRSRFS